MPVEFKVPELGENIESGDIVKWLVKPGDVVKKDQPLLELETGKAVVEVPSSVSGKVVALLAQEGDKVNVGDAVLTIDAEAEAAEEPAEKKMTEEKAQEKAPPKPKEKAAKKTTQPEPQPQQETALVAARAPDSVRPPQESGNGLEGTIPAAPVVKRIARELAIDLSSVRGTGPEGRITIEDVQALASRRGGYGTAPAGAPLPDFSRWGEVEAKPMTAIRRLTAQHLSQAWSTAPQVTQYDKADIEHLEDLRKRYAPRVEEKGGKLTMTAIMVKVIASSLEQFPHFNVSVDLPGNTIIYKKYIHVGVAVDTEHGLLVPVIRDANRKNIEEISVELAGLSERARSRKLDPSELEGGSISISNLGGIGGTAFSPIVNWPEVAILGISRSAMEPVWTDGKFVPRLMLPLSLTYDHRAVDGADAARFLRFVCESLEEPFLLALEG